MNGARIDERRTSVMARRDSRLNPERNNESEYDSQHQVAALAFRTADGQITHASSSGRQHVPEARQVVENPPAPTDHAGQRLLVDMNRESGFLQQE